jgi:sialate O-acetylesterase
MVRTRVLVFSLLLSAAALSAQVSLPKVLSNHMVIQRDLPVHVWGLAAPGQEVAVSFRGESRSVQADPLGHWSAYLKPGEAGGPFKLIVTPGATANGSAAQVANQSPITVGDVMVGDVWIASGQSNMEFPLSRASTAAQDLPHAANPQIRLLMINKRASDYAMFDADTEGWTLSTPETAKDFSAVAWYFARDIAAREHVTVGVVDSTWGGTVGESWVRLTALGEDASLAPIFVARGKMTDKAADADAEAKYEERQREEAKAAGKPAPQFPWHPPLNTWAPGLLWNGMIAPLVPMPIRGVIWYQGESNSALARVHSYDRVMRTLIEDWRRQWGIGDFPFLYVQISNFKSTPLEDWAELREQQVRTLAMRNTAMAVTIDIGNPDDVHPTDKLDVGLRLARAARALSYGENVEYSGPMFRQATPESGAIRVWFDDAKGLNAKGGTVTGFEVAGRDGRYAPASASIDGSTIVATSPEVPAPVYVRYGWANSPKCNVFNGEGLPASPFTSEE